MALVAAGAVTGVSSPASAAPVARVTVLSSAPDQVTGGDARIRVDLPPGLLGKARVLLDGDDVTGELAKNSSGALEGVVTGMQVGANTVEVTPTQHSSGTPANATLKLTDYPITGPVFSGPHQYPFVCRTERNGLGQPIVDNQDAQGLPVYALDSNGQKTTQVVGWSRDCSAPTRVDYMYETANGSVKPLPSGALPSDVATTTLLDGTQVPFVIRYERGTINRFIYTIAMLAKPGENPAHPDDSLWNGRLTYSFDGGVAIGHDQGNLSTGNSFQQSLGKGYAVIASTGTRTSTHYNLQVGGETALMVKEHFIEEHGVPLYTIGVGGSGGAIQQYVYGQNHKGLIDAAVPQYSYPDMVTQTIHVGDCELLEYFMDVTDKTNAQWNDPAMRQALEGLHVTSTPDPSGGVSQTRQVMAGDPLVGARAWTGSPATWPVSECRSGWFGLTPLAMDPTYSGGVSTSTEAKQMSPAGVMDTVDWTHWGDLRNIYGTDAAGYGLSTWDNVGVQYGLEALQKGLISPDEFLKLNATVGGWKQSSQMVPEGPPFVGAPQPGKYDPWSSRNMNLSADGGATPAPRTSGNVDAMNAAYDSGMVFVGNIDIPIIDWRHYLENQLNMHNSRQSFVERQRMLDKDGDASNQVIWFVDARPAVAFDPTPMAFQVLDQWMANRRAHPTWSAGATKPTDAVDRCFATDGTPIASGDHVWDGILNNQPAGACTQQFPIYETSRTVAGAPLEGNVYKCQLQSVGDAVAKGLYGSWVPTTAEQARLEQIFPTGVCDYTKPDAGRPTS